MAMSINTNLASLNSQRTLNGSQGALNTAMQRLSSGLRVNGAKDDASGLVVAERMNTQVRGNTVAIRNANDALGLTQLADGALGQVSEALQRMRELAVQGANGTYNTTDYSNMLSEITQLGSEITRVLDSTKFNNKAVFGASTTFQVGANNDTTEQIAVDLTKPDVAAATGAVAFTNAGEALSFITALDGVIETVGTVRTKIGADQNRFESVIATLQTNVEAVSGARGRIIDADFSKETSNLSRAQVLQQAGTAMLAQANQSAQNVMQLLR